MSCSPSICAACRGPQDVETETFCRACTEVMVLMSQDDIDDDQHVATKDDEPIANDPEPTADARCCAACQRPIMSHGPVSLCPECLEAVRICAESDFGDEVPQEEASLNDCHDHQEKSPHKASPAFQNGNSPGDQAGEAIIVSVKSPGKLIQEKFLAACARGDVMDLVFSPAEEPCSPVRVIVDVRTPVSESNPYLNNSKISSPQAPSSLLMPLSSSTQGSRSDVDDEDDCAIVAVIPLAHQIQDRIQQAEASGTLILLASQNDERDRPEATKQTAATAHSAVEADDEYFGTPIRKRLAPGSVYDVSATTTSGNPQGGLFSPMTRTKRKND